MCDRPGMVLVDAILGDDNYNADGTVSYSRVYVRQKCVNPYDESCDEQSTPAIFCQPEHAVPKIFGITDRPYVTPPMPPSHWRSRLYNIEYYDEQQRRNTYVGHECKMAVSCDDLARDGFVYNVSRDTTMCVFCRQTICGWVATDIARDVHRRNSPKCPLVNGECDDINRPVSRSPGAV